MMNEDEVEIWVERQIDKLDRKFLRDDSMTQEMYEDALEAIYSEAEDLFVPIH